MPKKSDILVARCSAVIKYDGKRVVLQRGKTTVHANHPMVRGRENLFSNLVVDYSVDQESETSKRLKEEAEAAAKQEAEPKVEEKDEEPKPVVKKAPVKKAAAQKENDVDG